MSIKLMSKAWELDLSQGEKLVLLALCDHANDDGVCYPSQAFLASKCSMSYRSVINQIKRLESYGILTSERRQKAGSRQSNSYTINLNNYKSQCENSAHANFAHANSAPTNVQNTTELCANSAHSFKEEPSINHQLEPSDISDGVTPASQAGLPQKKTAQKKSQANPDNVVCWESYARAYRNRYGVLPAANQKTRGQVATLVKYVGKEVAPSLAEYFLSHNGSWFVQCRHEFGCLLKSYQQVLTDMQRGEQMTQIKARQTESTQSNYEAAKSALAKLRAKGVA
ncbi:helix-turn-helix domain-containing protein [Snodgrassella alvi]|uniref:helix-turn-helix domain-containing protein n=1 Tax=Snodgrassella alvi TaxID=1196083 RepID=UPI000C1F5E98|nr:helix-turn-helix domain-containing protein [Snodgrassella alvi]PIT32597.1 hypothetical protein BHC42_07300 [Snodgrassella alvi]PIT34081.1 hypothetical protein BHC50_03925 [Snodgrassella alvi]WLT03734.1 helix-turn-helix domain-containing protein [Snodgrassella alvi]